MISNDEMIEPEKKPAEVLVSSSSSEDSHSESQSSLAAARDKGQQAVQDLQDLEEQKALQKLRDLLKNKAFMTVVSQIADLEQEEE